MFLFRILMVDFSLTFEIQYLKYFAGPICIYNCSLFSGLWSSTLILLVRNYFQMSPGLSWRLVVAVKDENRHEPIIPSPNCCLMRKSLGVLVITYRLNFSFIPQNFDLNSDLVKFDFNLTSKNESSQYEKNQSKLCLWSIISGEKELLPLFPS